VPVLVIPANAGIQSINYSLSTIHFSFPFSPFSGYNSFIPFEGRKTDMNFAFCPLIFNFFYGPASPDYVIIKMSPDNIRVMTPDFTYRQVEIK
jgi:hypothetical protein